MIQPDPIPGDTIMTDRSIQPSRPLQLASVNVRKVKCVYVYLLYRAMCCFIFDVYQCKLEVLEFWDFNQQQDLGKPS